MTAASVGRPPACAEVYAVDPAAAARGFGGAAPAGTTDFVAAVRPQPDAWTSVHSPAGDW